MNARALCSPCERHIIVSDWFTRWSMRMQGSLDPILSATGSKKERRAVEGLGRFAHVINFAVIHSFIILKFILILHLLF